MMIVLTKGVCTIVDGEDFLRFGHLKWCVTFRGRVGQYPYAVRKVRSAGRKVALALHREITGCPAGLVVDHINGDTLDNRRSNLRVVTKRENCLNQARHRQSDRGTHSPTVRSVP